MDKELTRKYTNDEITVVWKPGLCIHSTICWKQATGLPEVFDPRKKPWIKMEGAESAQIAAQVQKCPSGALSFFYNEAGEEETTVLQETKVEVTPNGPLLVYGNITVKDRNGKETRRFKVTAFCRCGQSKNKPYCDGSHIPSKFED